MKWLHIIAFLLLVIGGLNWGLIGLFHYNLVMMVFGSWPMVESGVYVLVGLSAIYLLITHKGTCMVCGMKGKK